MPYCMLSERCGQYRCVNLRHRGIAHVENMKLQKQAFYQHSKTELAGDKCHKYRVSNLETSRSVMKKCFCCCFDSTNRNIVQPISILGGEKVDVTSRVYGLD